MKVSIVTICYNNKDGLEKTIKSVIEQDFQDKEYIIIDGGSNDGSKDIILSYQSHIDYWVSEPDKGIYNAMNKGLQACSGTWVFFLNAGDVFFNRYVLSSIQLPDESEEVGAIFGKYMYYSRFGDLLMNDVKHPFTEIRKKHRSMGFSHQSVFVRTKLAKQYPFDESYRLCADFNMMMSIFKAGYKFVRTDTIISVCDGRGGISMNNRSLQDKEIARVCGCEFSPTVVLYRWMKQLIRPFYRFVLKYK